MAKHPWLLKPIRNSQVIDVGGPLNIRVELRARTMNSFGMKGFSTKIKKIEQS